MLGAKVPSAPYAVVPHVIAVVPPGRKYRTEAIVPLFQAAVKNYCRAGRGSTARPPCGSTVAGRGSTVISRKIVSTKREDTEARNLQARDHTKELTHWTPQAQAWHEGREARDNTDQKRDTNSPRRGRWPEPPMFESIGMAPRRIILGPMTKTRL